MLNDKSKRTTKLADLYRQEPLGFIAFVALAAVVLLAGLAPIFTKPPYFIDALQRLEGPSLNHYFGTDNFGRDIFSRTLFAGRFSLFLGFIVTLVSGVVGGFLGMIAGFYQKLESVIMRIMDGMMAFPPLVLAIALVAALGSGLNSEILALSVVFTPRVARISHGSTLHLKGSEYVEAAIANGSKVRTILFKHILPNALSPLVVQSSFIYAEAILADAALSFLGLGVSPPTPTWGNMVADARTYLTVAPWFSAFPGLAIVISVTALNLAGDTLRDLISPGSARSLSQRRRKTRPKVEVEFDTPTELSLPLVKGNEFYPREAGPLGPVT